MDAWETLIATATDTTDAWAALNSQQTGGGPVPGTAVNEILFTLTGVTSVTGTIALESVTGSTELKEITSIIEVSNITESLEPEPLPVNEGC